MLQEVQPPFIPEGARVMTMIGDPGAPPHQYSGPAFGYVMEGREQS